jgi:hypothetical protein
LYNIITIFGYIASISLYFEKNIFGVKKHDSAYYKEWFTEYPEFTGLKLKLWKLYLGNVPGKEYREKFRNRNVDIYGDSKISGG